MKYLIDEACIYKNSTDFGEDFPENLGKFLMKSDNYSYLVTGLDRSNEIINI